MFRKLLTCILVLTLSGAGFYWLVAAPRPAPTDATTTPPPSSPTKGKARSPERRLHAAEAKTTPAPLGVNNQPSRNQPLPTVATGAQPLIIIPEGRVNAIEKQEVPAQHDGQILFIGTAITEEEAKKLPQELVVKARVGSLWVQLSPGEKEKLHLTDADIRRWRVPVQRNASNATVAYIAVVADELHILASPSA